MSRTTKLTKI